MPLGTTREERRTLLRVILLCQVRDDQSQRFSFSFFLLRLTTIYGNKSDFPHTIVRKVSLIHLLTLKRSQLYKTSQVNNSSNKEKGNVALWRPQSLSNETSVTST